MHIIESSCRAALAALMLCATFLLPSLGAAAGAFDKAAIEIGAAGRPLVLTVYPNGIGRHILAKRYGIARSKLAAASLGSWSLTNLCVLHTVSKEWVKARPACDGAVETALRDRKRASYRSSTERIRPDTYAAIAYANRAVMFLLSRDIAAGRSDLLQARAIRPLASYVTVNLAAIRGLGNCGFDSLSQAEVDDVGLSKRQVFEGCGCAIAERRLSADAQPDLCGILIPEESDELPGLVVHRIVESDGLGI